MTEYPVTIEVSRDGWTKGYQVAIWENVGPLADTGYRLGGPKFNGSSKLLLKSDLNQRDADQIRRILDRHFPAQTASEAQQQETTQ